MRVGDERADITGAVGRLEALRRGGGGPFGSPLTQRTQFCSWGPAAVVRFVDRIAITARGAADVGLREEELADVRVEREAVHAVAGREDEDGRRTVEAYPAAAISRPGRSASRTCGTDRVGSGRRRMAKMVPMPTFVSMLLEPSSGSKQTTYFAVAGAGWSTASSFSSLAMTPQWPERSRTLRRTSFEN